MDTETISYDLDLNGTAELTRVIDRSRDNLLRDTGFQLKKAAVVENQATYGYHATEGRLGNVANPSTSFTYGYELNSNGLIKTITSPVHTVTDTYEANRDVLTSKQNDAGAFTRSGYTYGVNEIGQRTDLTTTFDLGGSNLSSNPGDTDWGYNSKGEVVKADHTIPGLDRAYVFDGIGNRLKSAEGTTDPDDPSASLYTPNALNQYTAIVSLNPVHDADGNMTSGPLPAYLAASSTLAWDAENRLISATVNGQTTNYRYDAQSRRIATVTPTGTATLTIYDGWNPIAEYSISNNQYSISKSFTWGIDLSGTIQGAGGVGGLLMVSEISNSQISNYFPTFDGNGNVSEYLNSTGVVVAHYEYDPFGKTTVATGAKANDFAHRFSTKPLDVTTGLYYYGYRYYDPNTGRWPSRDPIGEQGGINLYGFVRNNGIDTTDYYGLWFVDGTALDKDELGGVGGTIYVINGKYDKYVNKEALKNSPEAIQAAGDHEDRHISAAKASDDAKALPYKQVFCLKKGNERKYYFYTRAKGYLEKVEFIKGMSLYWTYEALMQYSTFEERNAEEIKETKIEIAELEKYKGSDFLQRRISLSLKPYQEWHEKGFGSTEKGDTPSWKSFVKVYDDEKKEARNKGYEFGWPNPENIYKELK